MRYRPNRRGKFPPKRRQILKGKIIDRNRKIGMYKIDIHPPGADTNIEKWVSVENITDISEKIANQKRQQKEKKRKLKRLRKELYIPKTEADHYEVFTNLGFTISYNPPGNGNCQFNAMCYFASSDWYPQITFLTINNGHSTPPHWLKPPPHSALHYLCNNAPPPVPSFLSFPQ